MGARRGAHAHLPWRLRAAAHGERSPIARAMTPLARLRSIRAICTNFSFAVFGGGSGVVVGEAAVTVKFVPSKCTSRVCSESL